MTENCQVIDNALAEDLLKFFVYDHLPEQLHKTAESFAELADKVRQTLPPGADLIFALRTLLEARNNAVLARLLNKF